MADAREQPSVTERKRVCAHVHIPEHEDEYHLARAEQPTSLVVHRPHPRVALNFTIPHSRCRM